MAAIAPALALELDLARHTADYYEEAAIRAYLDDDMAMCRYYSAQCERFIARATSLATEVR